MTKKKPQPWATEKLDQEDYRHKLNKEQNEWLTQFNQEFYNNGIYKQENPILNTKELRQEANRNYNNLKRDALELIARQDTYGDMSEIDKQFMEDASDEFEWRDAYKIGGEEMAGHVIYCLAMNEIESTEPHSWPMALTRFHIRLRYLDRMVYKEKYR